MLEPDNRQSAKERSVDQFFAQCVKEFSPQKSENRALRVWCSFRERSWDRLKGWGILLTSGGIAAATITNDPLVAVSVFGSGVYLADRMCKFRMGDEESWGDFVA